MKAIFRFSGLCLFMLAVLSGVAAQTDERGLEVIENANVAVFPQLGHTSWVQSVAFSPDGKRKIINNN